MSYRVENQEGLLTRYENQLARLGQGIGGRPCWVQENGEIDLLYDVVLRSDGIAMRERANPHRAAERARLPMPNVDPAESLTKSEFLRRTKPLYDHAKRENCVHFVRVYDADGSPREGRVHRPAADSRGSLLQIISAKCRRTFLKAGADEAPLKMPMRARSRRLSHRCAAQSKNTPRSIAVRLTAAEAASAPRQRIHP